MGAQSEIYLSSVGNNHINDVFGAMDKMVASMAAKPHPHQHNILNYEDKTGAMSVLHKMLDSQKQSSHHGHHTGHVSQPSHHALAHPKKVGYKNDGSIINYNSDSKYPRIGKMDREGQIIESGKVQTFVVRKHAVVNTQMSATQKLEQDKRENAVGASNSLLSAVHALQGGAHGHAHGHAH